MNDLELYIYIALALIYFLTRAFKPKKSPRPPKDIRGPASDSPDSTSRPARERPMTFEELLQEFTGYREPQQTLAPTREEEVEEEVQHEEIQEEEHEYKYYEGYDDYKKSSYADYNTVQQLEKDLTTIDEQVSFEEPLEKKFDWGEIEIVKSIQSEKYRKMLQNPESIRDAIILKELLDRKYF
jgi:hypothetical protein